MTDPQHTTTVIRTQVGTLAEFRPDDDWEIYQERLEQYFKANYIEEVNYVAVLLSAISLEAYARLRQLCDPVKPADKTFKQLCDLMKNPYSTGTSVFRERTYFYAVKQKVGESVREWFIRVKKAAMSCKFGSSLDDKVKDKFVTGLLPGQLLDRLCEEKETASLQDLFEVAINKEAVSNASSKGLDGIDAINKLHISKASRSLPTSSPNTNGICPGLIILGTSSLSTAENDDLTGSSAWSDRSDEALDSLELEPSKITKPCSVILHRLNYEAACNGLTAPLEGGVGGDSTEAISSNESTGAMCLQRVTTSRQSGCFRRQKVVCFHCRERFSLKVVLKEHVFDIHFNSILCCSHCKVLFRNKVELQGHIKETHKDFLCPSCDLKFKGKRSLSRHMQYAHSLLSTNVCPHCNQHFTGITDLKFHMNYKHNRNISYHCPHCEKEFTIANSLKRHILKVHFRQGYECSRESLRKHDQAVHDDKMELLQNISHYKSENEFGEEFLFLDQTHEIRMLVPVSKWEEDMKMDAKSSENSTDDIPFHCHHCPDKFSSKDSLTAHLRTHKGVKLRRPKKPTYPIGKKKNCFHCERRFYSKRRLKEHIVRTHLVASLSCAHCRLMFGTKQEWQQHVGETHPNLCTHCDLKFESERSLMRHIVYAHSIISSKVCPHCNKKYKTTHTFMTHMKHRHERKMTHQCPHCPKEYAYLGDLRRHIIGLHDKHRPFICHSCPLRFCKRGDLKRHIFAIHLKLKPYRCSLCPNSYSRKYQLEDHLKIFHEKVKDLVCPICGKGYGRNNDLARHIKDHHFKQYEKEV